MKTVEVQEYNPEWPAIFERIHSFVWPAVRDIALDLQHVGSTSVPGLAAKPVIDACIVVASNDDVPTAIERVARIGYIHRGNLGVPEREAFRQPKDMPKHHLYLTPKGSLSLKNHLGLRDYLRANPEAAREYGQLKLALARQFPEDMDSYIAGKTEFIVGILRSVGLTDEEIAAIENVNT